MIIGNMCDTRWLGICVTHNYWEYAWHIFIRNICDTWLLDICMAYDYFGISVTHGYWEYVLCGYVVIRNMFEKWLLWICVTHDYWKYVWHMINGNTCDTCDTSMIICVTHGLNLFVYLYCSYLARTDPADVARVEGKTFICTDNKYDTVPHVKEGVQGIIGRWMSPEAMNVELEDRFPGCMNGEPPP